MHPGARASRRGAVEVETARKLADAAAAAERQAERGP